MKNYRALNKPWLFLAVASVLVFSGCASKSPAPVYDRGGQPAQAVAGKDVYIVKKGDTLYSIAREHGMDFRELIALNKIENPNRITEGASLRVKSSASSSSVATVSPVVTEGVVTKPIDGAPAVEKRSLSADNTETFKREPKAGKVPFSEQALAQAQSQAAVVPPVAVKAAEPAKTEAKTTEPVAAGEVVWIWPAEGKTLSTFGEAGSKGLDIAGKAGDPVLAAADGKVLVAKSFDDSTLRGFGNMVVIKNSASLITVYAHNSKLLVKDGQTVSKGQKIAEMGSSGTDRVKLHFEVRNQGKPVDPLKYLPQR